MDLQKILSQSTGKPQKLLKIVLAISVVMLVLWLFLISKIDTGNVAQSQQPEVQQRTEGLKQSLLTPENEEAPVIKAEREQPDMMKNAFVTFFIMIGILGGIWLWTKRKGAQTGEAGNSRELGSHTLAPGSELKFLLINEEVWVVGLTAGNVNLLHKYSKDEWKESNSADQRAPVRAPKNDFKSLYKFFSN